jgi:hypothetical protein
MRPAGIRAVVGRHSEQLGHRAADADAEHVTLPALAQ